VAGRALTPATRHRLGGPLPRQLPDRTIADPKAINLWSFDIMGYYAQFPMPIPHLGVRSIVLLTLSPLALAGPFDLHALTMPPAFNLSQDQTLHLKSFVPSGLATGAGNLQGSVDLALLSIHRFAFAPRIPLRNRSFAPHHRWCVAGSVGSTDPLLGFLTFNKGLSSESHHENAKPLAVRRGVLDQPHPFRRGTPRDRADAVAHSRGPPTVHFSKSCAPRCRRSVQSGGCRAGSIL
jgi:hypothetical protein